MPARRQTQEVTNATSLLSPRDVGGHNRARVLRALVDHGPLSRSDIARLAGVTRATIGSIVQGLLDDELLEELEPLETGEVGKRARPLWFPAGAGSVAAVELRPDSARAALVDARGHIGAVITEPLTQPKSATAVTNAVRSALDAVALADAIGVGLTVPGTCDPFAGEVFGSSQIPGAVGRSLVESIRTATWLPVSLENDSRAQALAEQWFGLGRGVPTFASVQTGSGLGAGYVLDGAIYRGPRGVSGELGHTTVVVDGEPCLCGRRGCWETVASLRWLRREGRDRGLPRSSALTARRVMAHADDGNERAGDLVALYADHLGLGLANLHLLLGAELFILHGDAVGGGEKFRALIEAAASEHAAAVVHVAFTQLDDNATLLGAAGVVLSEMLHRPG